MPTKSEQIQNLVRTLGGTPRNSTIEDAIEDLVEVVDAGGIDAYKWYKLDGPYTGSVAFVQYFGSADKKELCDMYCSAGDSPAMHFLLSNLRNYTVLDSVSNPNDGLIIPRIKSAAECLFNAGLHNGCTLGFKTASAAPYDYQFYQLVYNAENNYLHVVNKINGNYVRLYFDTNTCEYHHFISNLRSPNGTRYEITVSDDGVVTATKF